MLMRKRRYYYLFGATLSAHVDLYKQWVDAARRKGLPVEMVTVLSFHRYIREYSLVKHYTKSYYIRVLMSPPKLSLVVTFLYFLVKALASEQLVVHLRKQSPKPLDLLKRLFGKRVRYIVELEGDPISEKEYLIEHPYKEGFYRDTLDRYDKYARSLPHLLKKADYILTRVMST